MSLQVHKRLLRSYRSLAPGPFHTFVQKVYQSFKDKSKIPAPLLASIMTSIVEANPELFQNFFTTGEKHDAVFLEATYGHKLAISERDILQAQLIIYLDEMALLVETAAIRNPDILLWSGFEVAKERRGPTRAKTAVVDSQVSTTEQLE